MFHNYNVSFYNISIFVPEKEAIDLGVPNVEAYDDVTGRFDIGHFKVNCCLFRPEIRIANLFTCSTELYNTERSLAAKLV